MQSLYNFNKFIEELSSNNSRNYKISVLEKYKTDEDIKYYLDFLFNPFITTGISKKSYQRFHHDGCIDVYPENIFNSTKEALEYLKVHNTSDDKTKELMFSYFMKVHLYDIKLLMEKQENTNLHELFYKIITKDLPLGIDAKTINKVIPNLIPTFDVMLANKYFDNPKIIEGKEFALTTKIDGGRIIAIKKNGIARFFTRQGQEYEGLVDLKEEMEKYFPDNICLDGEITLLNPYIIEKDENDEPAIGRKLTSKEQYKETMKIVRKDGEKHGVKMLVFDCMNDDQFENQKCDTPYYLRRYNLSDALSSASLHKDMELRKEGKYLLVGDKFPIYFEELPILYIGTNEAEILSWLEDQVNEGEEGIMINIYDAPYDFKRTNNLLKVKKFQDMELKITGFEEGTGKNQGKLGAFICEYKGNTVKVGSGLSDEEREEFWKNKETLLNKLITVKYFEETYDSKTGLPSLRFPTFLRFREL